MITFREDTVLCVLIAGHFSAKIFIGWRFIFANANSNRVVSCEAKVRLLDDTDNRDNSLNILEMPYMDQTMGMVIILPRVKTNPL